MAQRHRHHVLVVDDDPDCREGVKTVLEVKGYHVATANDGQEALDHVRQAGETICAILLDLMMPIWDGYWFRVQQLRDPDLARVPVVVMSGTGRVNERAQQLGCQEFIAKPVDPDQLLHKLRRCCPPK